MNSTDLGNYSVTDQFQPQNLKEEDIQVIFTDEDFELETEVLEDHLNLLPTVCSCSYPSCSLCI
jgi:hypothetical protein